MPNNPWPCWNVVDGLYDYEFPFPDQRNGDNGCIGGAVYCTIDAVNHTASMKLAVDEDNGTWLFTHDIPIPYDLAIRLTGHSNVTTHSPTQNTP